MNWPPIDFHAHLEPHIPGVELLALQAVIFAATRNLEEFETVSSRLDPVTVWGVGIHPASAAGIESFSQTRFHTAIARTPLVSEVGLDRKSDVPADRQKKVFREVLQVLEDSPRIASVHTAGATAETLEMLSDTNVDGVVLHWWRGTELETRNAVDLGCYFSINAREVLDPLVLGIAPVERLLTEIDHPFGDRTSVSKRRPGNVLEVEEALSRAYAMSNDDIRKQIWKNTLV